jgi:pyruvate carboxylase
VFRATAELGISDGMIAIYPEHDKLSLERFNADEAYLISQGMRPIENAESASIEDALKHFGRVTDWGLRSSRTGTSITVPS